MRVQSLLRSFAFLMITMLLGAVSVGAAQVELFDAKGNSVVVADPIPTEPTRVAFEGTTTYHFDPGNGGTLHKVSVASETAAQVLLEVFRFETNTKGEVTKRIVLGGAVADGFTSSFATLEPTMFASHALFVSVTVSQPVHARISYERQLPSSTVRELPGKPKEAETHGSDLVGIATGKWQCVRHAQSDDGARDYVLHTASDARIDAEMFDDTGKKLMIRNGTGSVIFSSVAVQDPIICVRTNAGNVDAPAVWRSLVAEATQTVTTFERAGSNPDILSSENSQSGILDSKDLDRFHMATGLVGKPVEFTLGATSDIQFCFTRTKQKECLTGRNLVFGPIVVADEDIIELAGRQTELIEYSLTAALSQSQDYPEPNAQADWQEPIAGGRVSGMLSTPDDLDVIALDTGFEAGMWRVMVIGETVTQATVSSGGSWTVSARRKPETGKRLLLPDAYLPAGISYVSIKGDPGPYKVLIKPLGTEVEGLELEPNDAHAQFLPMGGKISGQFADGDLDKFSFTVKRPSRVRLFGTVPANARANMRLLQASKDVEGKLVNGSLTGGAWSEVVELGAGVYEIWLNVRTHSPAPYELGIELVSPFDGDDISAQLAVAPLETARAFFLGTQMTELVVTIHNEASLDVNGELHVWADDPKVHALPFPVMVSAGKSARFSIPVDVSADRSTGDIVLFVALKDDRGAVIGKAPAVLPIRVNVPALAPTQHSVAPGTMIGGINVALTALGAQWIDVSGYTFDANGEVTTGNPTNAENLLTLIDGVIGEGDRHFATLGRGKPQVFAPILKLQKEFELAGIGLATRTQRGRTMSQFAIDVSGDGQTWTEALKANHTERGPVEYFEFPNGPHLGQFVRLRPLVDEDAKQINLGLTAFEVIAVPGYSGLKDINIADTRLGAITTGGQTENLSPGTQIELSDQSSNRFAGKASPTDLRHSISFKNGRTADIASVELHYLHAPKDARWPYATEAHLHVSETGPAGPFRLVTSVDLPTDPKPGDFVSVPVSSLENVKSVRVEYSAPEEAYFLAPNQVRVLERSEGDRYRSVVGLWGEFTYAKTVSGRRENAHVNPLDQATSLPLDGTKRIGLVSLGTEPKSWTVSLPQDATGVKIAVAGEFGFTPQVDLKDASGAAIAPTSSEPDPDGRAIIYTYPKSWEGDAFLTVSRETQSTIFLFDQSASLAGQVPAIRSAILRFAEDMVVGRDFVKYLSLGDTFQDDQWFNDPNLLRRSIIRYKGVDTSQTEDALVEAAKQMQGRTGSKAIVIITDGDGSARPDTSVELSRAQAKVFVVKTPSNGMFQDPSISQPVTMSWASQTNGEVLPLLNVHDLPTAYARVSDRIKGPQMYEVSAQASAEPLDLAPGELSVVTAMTGSDPTGNGTLIILLDASGSMLRREGTLRRIEMAKASLGQFLESLYAQDAKIRPKHLGLTTFGGAAGTCETKDILNADDHDLRQVVAALTGISPQNKAKTPIGAALGLVADRVSDLKNKPVEVLLITDGEETCDGDPLAAIQRLRDEGVETRLNVISFALDASVDRAPFEAWAKAGGGNYVDADSQSALSDALSMARETPFQVFDGDTVVASGIVNGPAISLEPGDYLIGTAADEHGIPITIRPSQVETLTLGSK